MYTPKVLLLTGGAGFIGSNTLCHLVLKYPEMKVICLDKLDYCANTRNFEEIMDNKNFKFIKGDICSSDLVNHILESYNVDTILHFAAQTHVDNSFGNSFQFTQSNVMGTHVMLESAKKFKHQIKRFIHVSTDEVYGESHVGEDRKTEDCRLDPTNPYAATKAAAEFLVKSYARSFHLPLIITRGNNVYGPKQYPEKLIPKFIILLSKGQSCPLHGDGSHRRSFLYVSDVAEAFDVILHNGKLGEVYNIGSDFEISNRDVLLALLDEFGVQDKEKYVKFVRDRAFNDYRYHIDTSTLEALGWTRKVNFAEGLRKTKDWYLTHSDWWGDVSQALTAHPVVGQTIAPEPETKVHKDGLQPDQHEAKRQRSE